MKRQRLTRKDGSMPISRHAAVLAAALALPAAACADFPPRPAPPADNVVVADSVMDSTPAQPAPARPRNRPRPARTGGTTTSTTRTDTAPPVPAPVQRPSPSVAPRRDLERLVTAQEQHIANVGRYASRIQYLALRYLPQAGVNLMIESASDSGWVGRATRDGWTGSSCVVWVDKVPARPQTERQKLQPSQSGAVVCDSP
jgi:hypothetical protein